MEEGEKNVWEPKYYDVLCSKGCGTIVERRSKTRSATCFPCKKIGRNKYNNMHKI